MMRKFLRCWQHRRSLFIRYLVRILTLPAMRIGIDARFYGSSGKGLGRYTERLIEALEREDEKNEYVIFLRRENFDEYQPYSKRFTKVRADYAWYGFAEQFLFPWQLWREQLDLVHFPHFNVPIFYLGRFVVTIHDLILLRYPTVRNTTRLTIWYWMKFLVYRMVIRVACFRARRVITVSPVLPAKFCSRCQVPENGRGRDCRPLGLPDDDESMSALIKASQCKK